MRRAALSAAAAVGFALIALLVSVGVADAATLPTGFEERTVASGLSLPTAIAFAPDGRMFIAEKDGVVRVRTNTGAIVNVLDIRSHVNTDADRGLEGIAVDSEFAANHYLYLLYVYEPTPAPAGTPRTSRLTRVTVADDNTASAETVLLGTEGIPPCPKPSNTLDCMPADSLSHMVGTVRSDTDGTLWVGNGDASAINRADPVALRTYDEQSLSGKIIHVDRNGNGLPGHPFCAGDDDLTHVCTKLYAKGLRNPYRFALRPGTGPAIGDVGWNTAEEENLSVAPGQNFGWPCYEGQTHTSGYREFPECQAEYAKEGTNLADSPPDYHYGHTPVADYSAAIIGGPAYPGGSYPSEFDGNVFIADYALTFIKRLQIDAQGHVVGELDFATGAVPVDLELGPGNDLYYADLGDGNPGTGSVKRVLYTPNNRTPIAKASADPAFGPMPLQVTLSGTGSSDFDDDPITYEWDFGDGSPYETQRDATHTYTTPGEYAPKLTVTDDKGASNTAFVHVSVGNSPPVAAIESPVDASEFLIGSTIELRGKATDAEEGRLTGASLHWQVSLIHNSHTHDLTGLTGENPSFTTMTDHDANSHYRITLIATDSAGRTDTKTVHIYPKAVNLRLESSPTGAPIAYSGTERPGPFAQQAAIGFSTFVSAAPTFEYGGIVYEFAGWSDDGARTHDITIPSSDVLLTATYRPQTWFEGETMTPNPNDGVAVRTIQDSDASGGQALSFERSPGSAAKLYTIGSDANQVRLRMRGNSCAGLPSAIVSIDDLPASPIEVTSSTYRDFALPLEPGVAAVGTHTIQVAFDDARDDVCGRGFYLDKISFHQVAPPGAALPDSAPPPPIAPEPPAQVTAPAPTVDPAVSKWCADAIASRSALRRKVSRARREARRAKHRLRVAGDVDARLHHRHRVKERRLRRMEARLAEADRAVRVRC